MNYNTRPCPLQKIKERECSIAVNCIHMLLDTRYILNHARVAINLYTKHQILQYYTTHGKTRYDKVKSTQRTSFDTTRPLSVMRSKLKMVLRFRSPTSTHHPSSANRGYLGAYTGCTVPPPSFTLLRVSVTFKSNPIESNGSGRRLCYVMARSNVKHNTRKHNKPNRTVSVNVKFNDNDNVGEIFFSEKTHSTNQDGELLWLAHSSDE